MAETYYLSGGLLSVEDQEEYDELYELYDRYEALYMEAMERGDETEAERIQDIATPVQERIEAILRSRRIINPQSGDRERETEEAMALRRMNEVNRINEINQGIERQREVLRRMNEMNNQNALQQRAQQGRGVTNQQNVFSGAGRQSQRAQPAPTLRETLEPRYDPRVNPPQYDQDEDD